MIVYTAAAAAAAEAYDWLDFIEHRETHKHKCMIPWTAAAPAPAPYPFLTYAINWALNTAKNHWLSHKLWFSLVNSRAFRSICLQLSIRSLLLLICASDSLFTKCSLFIHCVSHTRWFIPLLFPILFRLSAYNLCVLVYACLKLDLW